MRRTARRATLALVLAIAPLLLTGCSIEDLLGLLTPGGTGGGPVAQQPQAGNGGFIPRSNPGPIFQPNPGPGPAPGPTFAPRVAPASTPGSTFDPPPVITQAQPPPFTEPPPEPAQVPRDTGRDVTQLDPKGPIVFA